MAGRQGLRIAFFGTDGALSRKALSALALEHRIVAVVAPQPPARSVVRRALSGTLGRWRPGSLAELARGAGAVFCPARDGRDSGVAERLGALAPDLVCIAGFPWLLSEPMYARAPLGGVNVHAALLPRHRGPLPLFWIYFRDDRETGVTTHRVTETADGGDILEQEAFPLPRGFPVETLNLLNAERGAALLQGTVRKLAAGSAVARAQAAELATAAPRVRAGTPMVDFAGWPAERVWHFLAGLFPRFREPLVTAGRPAVYGAVTGFTTGQPGGEPGTVTAHGAEWRLHCVDGWVGLRPPRPGG